MPNPENVIENGFRKNPQNINRKGVPKKMLNSMLEYLEKTYGKPISKAEGIRLLEYVETLPTAKLVEFVKDANLPAIVQAYGRLVLSGDQKDLRRVTAAEFLKDRVHGKATQSTVNTNIIQNVELTPEKIREINKALEGEY
jgi:hypothetical protein